MLLKTYVFVVLLFKHLKYRGQKTSRDLTKKTPHVQFKIIDIEFCKSVFCFLTYACKKKEISEPYTERQQHLYNERNSKTYSIIISSVHSHFGLTSPKYWQGLRLISIHLVRIFVHVELLDLLVVCNSQNFLSWHVYTDTNLHIYHSQNFCSFNRTDVLTPNFQYFLIVFSKFLAMLLFSNNGVTVI